MATATCDPGAAAEFSEMSVTVVCGADCACSNDAAAKTRTAEKKRFHIIARYFRRPRSVNVAERAGMEGRMLIRSRQEARFEASCDFSASGGCPPFVARNLGKFGGSFWKYTR
jgi:hypothetical protein